MKKTIAQLRCDEVLKLADYGNIEIATAQRMMNSFYRLCGLSLCYCGYMPSIGTKSKSGAFSEKIYRYFYK